MPQLDFDGANSKISADKIQGQSGTTVTIPAGHNLAGDGSGLTSLPAANLTGTVAGARLPDPLPAIDGSNLTGVGGGVATGSNQVAQVWAMFDGNGTGTIDDYNVSSITDNGTGDWTVNFTSAFADENFCSQLSCDDPNHNASLLIAHSKGMGAYRTTTSEQVLCQYVSGTASDGSSFISYVAFGDV